MNGKHTHDMSLEAGGIYECNSCLFRCTTAKLAEVKRSPQLHQIVRKGSKQAGKVWS